MWTRQWTRVFCQKENWNLFIFINISKRVLRNVKAGCLLRLYNVNLHIIERFRYMGSSGFAMISPNISFLFFSSIIISYVLYSSHIFISWRQQFGCRKLTSFNNFYQRTLLQNSHFKHVEKRILEAELYSEWNHIRKLLLFHFLWQLLSRFKVKLE